MSYRCTDDGRIKTVAMVNWVGGKAQLTRTWFILKHRSKTELCAGRLPT